MKKIHIDDIGITIRKHHWAKRMNLKVARDGEVTVTIPKRAPYRLGETFARSKQTWIEQQLIAQPKVERRPATPVEKRQARELVERKLQRWGPDINLAWQKVRIANQKTRWGSCSTKGTLSFSWRLIELPEPLVDYVIVHELCHLTHMNHSPDFWSLVGRHVPDYKARRKRLKAFDTTGTKE